MTPFRGTSRRLLIAFGSLVLLLGAASVLALRGLDEVHRGLHSVSHQEEGVRRSLALAMAVREQYAHVAHTIILGNDSHVPMFEAARDHVVASADELAAVLENDDQRRLLEEIRTSSAQLVTIFETRVLPPVRAGDIESARAAHHEILALVDQIQASSDRLAGVFESGIDASEKHAGTVQHAAFRWTLILLAAAVAYAAAMGLYIGRSVARPVGMLEQGALKLGAGDLETRIELDSDDEFGRLARQFNAMTRALREHQERLVQTEKLAGIGRLAAGVAHEINNPLTVMLGYVRLLRKKPEPGTDADLAVIEDETLRCQQIVKDLLDLARPDARGADSVSLRELALEVVDRLRDAGQVGAVVLTVNGDARVAANASRLRQVLVNLVRNAVEAAAPEGRVTLDLGAGAGEAWVKVQDSGAGLAPPARDKLFEPFFTTKPHGTGLGLAVSQAIVRAHGGRIEATSEPGRGATFTVHLPAGERA